MKSLATPDANTIRSVALFTRAWIEIIINGGGIVPPPVALFTRAWIEIQLYQFLP